MKVEWQALNDELFEHTDFKPFKSGCYKKNDSRKIQEKYKQYKDSVQAEMATGNKSKYVDDLSPVFRTIQQMVIEEEDAKEEKEADKELKRKLDENIELVLPTSSKKTPMQGFGSRKSLDGSVDSRGSTPVSKSNPMEGIAGLFKQTYKGR